VPYRSKKREALPQIGTDYADAVEEFMNSRGFERRSRAENTGEEEDLIFDPKLGNKASVVAEAKYRSEDSKFSPNDYKEGFAERFRQWEGGAYQDYKFHIFVSNVANESLWKDLFYHIKEDAIESFYSKMRDEVGDELADFLKRHGPSMFAQFAQNTVVWAGYEPGDLIQIAHREQASDEGDYEPYLKSYEAKPESGNLRSNLLRITSLPEILYRISAVGGTDTKSFYRHWDNKNNPVDYQDGFVYSLLSPEDLTDDTLDFCKTSEVDKLDFSSWADKDDDSSQVDTAKALLRGLLTMAALENNAYVTRKRGDVRVYKIHSETDLEHDNKWITQELDEHPEIRHRTISIHVKRFDGAYYYAFSPRQEFTRDGRIPVSGERKKQLSADFSPSAYPQNKRKLQTVDIWEDILNPQQSLLRMQQPKPLREIRWERVENLTISGVRPPETPAERDELIEGKIKKESVSEEGRDWYNMIIQEGKR